jgi:hypothetical protein
MIVRPFFAFLGHVSEAPVAIRLLDRVMPLF